MTLSTAPALPPPPFPQRGPLYPFGVSEGQGGGRLLCEALGRGALRNRGAVALVSSETTLHKPPLYKELRPLLDTLSFYLYKAQIFLENLMSI
jgi:hypothetical protein